MGLLLVALPAATRDAIAASAALKKAGAPADAQPASPASPHDAGGIAPTAPERVEDAGAAEDLAPIVQLDADSTLTQWKAADASARSRLSVEIARKRLGDKPDRLELARTAMEITGCVSRTASDARFGGWKVGATASTCLTAPEKPAPVRTVPPDPARPAAPDPKKPSAPAPSR